MRGEPEPSALEHARPAFVERDAFLHALLGLMSWTRSMERQLGAADGGAAPRVADEFVDMLLGLFSIQRALLLPGADDGASPARPDLVARPALWARDLLR